VVVEHKGKRKIIVKRKSVGSEGKGRGIRKFELSWRREALGGNPLRMGSKKQLFKGLGRGKK